VTRFVLILGSAPNAMQAAAWPRGPVTDIVVINNAWRIRDDWDVLIHPDDFPQDRWPQAVRPEQRVVQSDAYVPIQNDFGGFVYAGGTMAFTAGYWALGALKPDVMAFMGCDMVYAPTGNTHFYGQGAPDPLREDISLRDLAAKSARLMLLAARQGCACVNLSDLPESRLVFPRATLPTVPRPMDLDLTHIDAPLAEEARLGYLVPSGKYWKEQARFDTNAIDALDAAWVQAWQAVLP